MTRPDLVVSLVIIRHMCPATKAARYLLVVADSGALLHGHTYYRVHRINNLDSDSKAQTISTIYHGFTSGVVL
jgi:hypothetical protein